MGRMGDATELLERDAERAELSRLLESARSGEGRIALVYGEAGIGKTALVTELARIHARDVRLFWGACDPLSTPRPLAPLLDIAWTQGGGQLAGRIAAGASREAIFQAFFEELRSPKPPAIVVIEDLHWADEATLDLVKFLGRRAQRTTALLVLTWREDGMRADHPLRASIGELPRRKRPQQNRERSRCRVGRWPLRSPPVHRSGLERRARMPRYLVERSFPQGLVIPIDASGEKFCLSVVESNGADGVTWVHSYVSDDRRRSFCVCDAPSPEAIRRTAARNKLPVDRITQVRVLDPYFYR